MDLFNKKKLKEVTKEKDYYERVCEAKNKTINNLQEDTSELNKNMNNLIKENQKLIDWIEKIINEVGVKTTCKENTVRIPYYEDIRYEQNRIEKAYEENYFPRQERKDIIIPSIRFIKIECKN